VGTIDDAQTVSGELLTALRALQAAQRQDAIAPSIPSATALLSAARSARSALDDERRFLLKAKAKVEEVYKETALRLAEREGLMARRPEAADAATALPTVRGYTFDARLREFRLMALGQTPEFVPFDSPKGQELLAAMRRRPPGRPPAHLPGA
jgi:hypothetical protein